MDGRKKPSCMVQMGFSLPNRKVCMTKQAIGNQELTSEEQKRAWAYLVEACSWTHESHGPNPDGELAMRFLADVCPTATHISVPRRFGLSWKGKGIRYRLARLCYFAGLGLKNR